MVSSLLTKKKLLYTIQGKGEMNTYCFVNTNFKIRKGQMDHILLKWIQQKKNLKNNNK